MLKGDTTPRLPAGTAQSGERGALLANPLQSAEGILLFPPVYSCLQPLRQTQLLAFPLRPSAASSPPTPWWSPDDTCLNLDTLNLVIPFGRVIATCLISLYRIVTDKSNVWSWEWLLLQPNVYRSGHAGTQYFGPLTFDDWLNSVFLTLPTAGTEG